METKTKRDELEAKRRADKQRQREADRKRETTYRQAEYFRIKYSPCTTAFLQKDIVLLNHNFHYLTDYGLQIVHLT